MYAKNILLISPEPWNGTFVSKHHYAIELAKRGNSVYFLNPPSTKDGIRIHAANDFEKVFIIDYKVYIKGQRFLPAFAGRYLNKRVFLEFERQAGCRFDIIWNFENSRFYDFSFAPANVLKVCHQVDLNQNFHPDIAARTADICFCTTEFIKERLLSFNKAVFKIGHGFSGKFTSEAFELLNGKPSRYHSPRRVSACYVGNLDIAYLELDILESLIKTNPDVDFIFVGPYSKEKEFYSRVSKYSNVNLKGLIRGDQIPTLLQQADILLLLYKAEEFKEQLASPHKMLEYLASGKVVVATYTEEYKDKRDLLLMADRTDQIPDLFSYALQNLQSVNAPEQMALRIQFALDHTYERQLDIIESYINQMAKDN